MKRLKLVIAVFAILGLCLWAVSSTSQDTSISAGVYRGDGGDLLVVQTGGTLQVATGGTLQIDAGATFTNDGSTTFDDLAVGGLATIGETLTVTGLATMIAAASVGTDLDVGDALTVTGTAEITGALTQTGAATFASTVQVTGALNHIAQVITSGTTVAVTVTASQSGALLVSSLAGDIVVFDLPDAAAGLIYHAAIIIAGSMTINPQSGDTILHLTNAAGDAIQNAATIGDHVTLIAPNATEWVAISEEGTWSDVN